MIPKKIHYCWYGGNELPILNKKCINTWKEKLPDFEIIRWDEENTPMNIPFIKHYHKKEKWAYVSDYMRYWALRKYGGIYLDTDFEIVKNLSPLLDQPSFIAEEEDSRLNSGVLASEKGQEFLDATLKFMEDRYEHKKAYMIAPEVCENVIRNKYENEITIYSKEYFYPYNPYSDDPKRHVLFYTDITENTYGIHHWSHSWELPIHERIIRRFRLLWE